MEMSLLTFKGSISEAVIEAKKARKLFLVYVSGEDGTSMLLENTTCMDLNVAETISKNCIFLHLVQGSNDATNFSAIYPQKSVPCITIIGYNGVMLWQEEGCTSSDNLVSSIKQALATLHIQETTATFLTAALASKKSEPPSPSSSNVAFEQGSTSSSDIPNSLIDKPLQDSDNQALVVSGLSEGNRGSEAVVESEVPSPSSIHANKLKTVIDEQAVLSSEPSESTVSTITNNLDRSKIQFRSSNVGGVCTAAEDNTSLINQVLESLPASSEIANDMESNVEDKKADASDNFMDAHKSIDVYLNIRWPDGGGSLQKKFLVTDTLRLVKDYVDENRSGIGSYDLAVPYPRKVFKEQDFSKELSELGLFNRQALVVVPRHSDRGFDGARTLSNNHTTSASHINPSNDNQEGYFGRLKRILSYVNPLSYLGNASSSVSEQEANNGLRQYSPNRNLPNPSPGSERPYRLYSPNSDDNTTSSTGGNTTTSKSRTKASGFRSNIHTLKHDDDEGPSRDRNTFWNGNSTQYSGNNNDDTK